MICPDCKKEYSDSFTHNWLCQSLQERERLTRYTLIQDGTDHQIEAAGWVDARAQAEEWVGGVDWDTSTGTIWLEVYMTAHAPSCDSEDYDCEGESCERDSITIGLDPEEPDCAAQDEHTWEPGLRVSGSGGGVKSTEVCLSCGCSRTTDTWAQDSSGREGLTSVTYSVSDDWPAQD